MLLITFECKFNLCVVNLHKICINFTLIFESIIISLEAHIILKIFRELCEKFSRDLNRERLFKLLTLSKYWYLNDIVRNPTESLSPNYIRSHCKTLLLTSSKIYKNIGPLYLSPSSYCLSNFQPDFELYQCLR